MKRVAIALALIGASATSLPHASHAMSLAVPGALKDAVPSQTSQVYWRGGGWGPALGFGIAAGALTAAAFASRPYWGGGYYGGYWGGYPGYAYAPAYDYAPAYAYAPAYSYAYGPGYGYGPASYAYGPGYSYAYGTTYVRPRARYVYGRVGPRVRYGSTSGYGVRHASRAGPYRGAMTTRAVHRRR